MASLHDNVRLRGRSTDDLDVTPLGRCRHACRLQAWLVRSTSLVLAAAPHRRPQFDDATGLGELLRDLLGPPPRLAVDEEEPGEVLLGLGVRTVGGEVTLRGPAVERRRGRVGQRFGDDELARVADFPDERVKLTIHGVMGLLREGTPLLGVDLRRVTPRLRVAVDEDHVLHDCSFDRRTGGPCTRTSKPDHPARHHRRIEHVWWSGPVDAAELARRFALGGAARLSDGPVARGKQGGVWRLETADGSWAVELAVHES